jgi:iron complex transport system substrate-binding protein
MNRLRIKNNATLFLGIFVFLFIGCTGKQKSSDSFSEGRPHSSTTIKYAKGFRIEHFDGYTRLTILNPWDNSAPYQTYNLYKDNAENNNLPSDGTHLRIPLE